MMVIEIKVPDECAAGVTLAAGQLLQGSVDRGLTLTTHDPARRKPWLFVIALPH